MNEVAAGGSGSAPGGGEAPLLLGDLGSASPALRNLLELSRRVAAADSSLLILGETGVGKEFLARAIHAESPRRAHPFIAVNCAAISESLLESELFGHEKGAFTGAVRSRRGYFELAHRGTLFLDEIGDMSPHLQVKLLRVLQDRRFLRIGGEEPVAADVRIIAATNRNLEEAMEQKAFRRDLYYRLGVVTLTVPPLRERREDLPGLLRGYLARIAERLGRPVTGIDEAALAALVAYSWPGNVRELINVVERAVLLCSGSTIGATDLPAALQAVPRPPAAPEPLATDVQPAARPLVLELPADWLERPLRQLRHEVDEELERRYLAAQLEHTRGRVGEAAARAGLDPRSLYEKMRALGLRKEQFRRRRR